MQLNCGCATSPNIQMHPIRRFPKGQELRPTRAVPTGRPKNTEPNRTPGRISYTLSDGPNFRPS
eukprot:2242132-Pyramimonas_sp.AAC.1